MTLCFAAWHKTKAPSMNGIFKVIASSALIASCGLISSGCRTNQGAAETPTYSNDRIADHPKYMFSSSPQGSSTQNQPDQQNKASGVASTPGGESRGSGATTITDLSTLAQATDVSSLSGRPIQISNVEVQEVVDSTLIAVVGEGTRMPIYAHLQQPLENIKPGDKVSFTGIVREPTKTPGLAAALSTSAAQAINAQPFFLEAQSAQVSKQ
jgi:hypothetical protein